MNLFEFQMCNFLFLFFCSIFVYSTFYCEIVNYLDQTSDLEFHVFFNLNCLQDTFSAFISPILRLMFYI